VADVNAEPFAITWHSNAPISTGYGVETGLFVPRISSLGYRMTISAYYGIQASTSQWQGHLMLPAGQDPYGSDVIAKHVEVTKSDLLITLLDAWVLDRSQIRAIREQLSVPVACWLPVDVARLGEADESFIRETGVYPIAMSRHGKKQLEARGIRCAYVPHGVDCRVFRPPADRAALRAGFNLTGRFTCGINSANKGTPSRKNFASQMEAFRIFRDRHPEANALLLLHTWQIAPAGENLRRMAERKGLPPDAYSFSDQYAYTIGQITPQLVADWSGAIDVLMNCSYGEGFGIPVIEAQAAGTPVIVTDATSMPELCGAGWKVPGQKLWNEFHGEDWCSPSIDGIVRALEKAYALWRDNDRDHGMDRLREKARKFALRYDADLVLDRYWKPVLRDLEAARRGMLRIGADRDAAVARLSAAWSDGRLDAEAFGGRAARALSAAGADDLIPLVADLPEAA
jgi:glycosyltransferase involved in cell wall biosynthesis